ncbi:11459_t:CDS:2, partial [Acaulospora colombiana]
LPSQKDSGANIARWKFDNRKERKLEERVYKGIPDRWRTAAWYTLMERMASSYTFDAAVQARKSGQDFKRIEQLQIDYREAIDLPSTFDIQIDLDVPRTISGHVMFKTRYGMG